MDLSKLIHGFLKVVTWSSQNLYMDLLNLLYGYVKVITWICQTCCIFFLALSKTKPSWCLTNTFVDWLKRSIMCRGSIPWVRCAFGIVFFVLNINSTTNCQWALVASLYSLLWDGKERNWQCCLEQLKTNKDKKSWQCCLEQLKTNKDKKSLQCCLDM